MMGRYTKIILSVMFLWAAIQPTGSHAVPSANTWTPIAEGHAGHKTGSVLVPVPEMKKFFLIGRGVQVFDPESQKWEEFSKASPKVKRGIHPYYQAAYDPGTKTIYCLSGGPVLYSFSLEEKTWKTHPAADALKGLSWHTMACDPVGKQLVVVGSDKKTENVGWTRTVLYDISAGTWKTLAVPEDERTAHQTYRQAWEAAIDLVGRIRMAWYRDPEGVGTDEERARLSKRCDGLKSLAGMKDYGEDIAAVKALVETKKTLDALKTARSLKRRMEEAEDARYPVPCSRRNSPLVYEPRSKVMVLFGGDHEDYHMNDTWVLNLAKGTWSRLQPEHAPSPRAGHALVSLPSGHVLLYEGYHQSSSANYGARGWYTINPRQAWVLDLKKKRWDLVAAWSRKNDGIALPGAGGFYGYSAQYFNAPALGVDREGRLVLATATSKRTKSRTWSFKPDLKKLDVEGRDKLVTPPNRRRYRTGSWVASFCEVGMAPKPTGLDQLPANRWVKFPAPPKNPCRGRRQRDWGTYVWDSDCDQILLWGGGHCVQSSSPVAHFSPISGRIVEGYDADEPYGGNGGGGFDSSVLNRPWISVHNYNHYAYDPKCKLMVTSRGYLYDPDRMDWIRQDRITAPFRLRWSTMVVETTPHGAVTWAPKRGKGVGLWLFDKDKGWIDLEPKGDLFRPYCDSDGMVYDSKRDRMVIGWGGGYNRKGDGSIREFSFQTKEINKVMPENIELGKMYGTREMVYHPELDCVLFGSSPVRVGPKKKGKVYTVVYHCAKNKYFLLDAGSVPHGHSAGWMYDAKRKLVYVILHRGEAWALRIDPKTVKLLDKAPDSST